MNKAFIGPWKCENLCAKQKLLHRKNISYVLPYLVTYYLYHEQINDWLERFPTLFWPRKKNLFRLIEVILLTKSQMCLLMVTELSHKDGLTTLKVNVFPWTTDNMLKRMYNHINILTTFFHLQNSNIKKQNRVLDQTYNIK